MNNHINKFINEIRTLSGYCNFKVSCAIYPYFRHVVIQSYIKNVNYLEK